MAQSVECLTRDRGFEPHQRHCLVSLSKNINPSLVLVKPRKTRPFITEILLMGCKESNPTKNKQKYGFKSCTHVYFFYMIVCTKKTISTALSTLITLDGIAEVKQPSLLSSLRENGHSQA